MRSRSRRGSRYDVTNDLAQRRGTAEDDASQTVGASCARSRCVHPPLHIRRGQGSVARGDKHGRADSRVFVSVCPAALRRASRGGRSGRTGTPDVEHRTHGLRTAIRIRSAAPRLSVTLPVSSGTRCLNRSVGSWELEVGN